MTPAAAAESLRAWIDACQRGLGPGAARALLSPAFTRHIGLDAAGFVAQERGLYRQAPRGLGLDIVAVEKAGGDTALVRYRVLAPDGWLLFESTQVLDPDGRVRGNGSAFDVVPKLAFTSAGVRLGLAVRSTLGALRAVVAMPATGGEVPTVEIYPAAGDPAARYDTVRLGLSALGDDPPPTAVALRLRLLADQGRETVAVQVPGRDHPFFRPALSPVIDGRTVSLPAYPGRYWALVAALDDGRERRLAQPRPGAHRFARPVVAATLTDALDLDWEAGAAV